MDDIDDMLQAVIEKRIAAYVAREAYRIAPGRPYSESRTVHPDDPQTVILTITVNQEPHFRYVGFGEGSLPLLTKSDPTKVN